jgi:multidrug efflux pump subunit AcrA (membrane-fusion protein)
VRTVFVLSGLVLVQTVVPTPVLPVPPPTPPARRSEFDDVTEMFVVHLTDLAAQLLVHEGERERRGLLLARLRYRNPETAQRRQHAITLVGSHEAALALKTANLRQAEVLVTEGLAVPGAVDRERMALLRAEETLAQMRRVL